MFNTRNLWRIAALVCVSGLAAAQTAFHAAPRGGAIDVSGKMAPIPPGAGEAMCFGDGSGAKCPVNNPGLPGRGCDNSANTGGAVLRLTGAPSIIDDTLVFGVRALPPTTTAIYMQAGKLRFNPKPFGNGIMCLYGPITRLAVKHAVNSTSRYPEFGEPGAATTGKIFPGESVFYQVMYRDPFVGDITHMDLNMTNAWHTVWTP